MGRPVTAVMVFSRRYFLALWLLLTERRMPLLPRVAAVLAGIVFVAYTRNPHQIIPQNVPIFGYFDDVCVLLVGLFFAQLLIPRALLRDAGFRSGRRGFRVTRAGMQDGNSEVGELLGTKLYPPKKERKVPDPDLFLIVCNGRTGSTWLETCLGEVPGVFTDCEIVWRPSYRPLSIHRVIDGGGRSLRDELLALSDDAPIIGSKFVADPHKLFSWGREREILDALDRDLRLIHLTRNYFDILLSGLARGYVHRANLRSGKPVAGNKMLDFVSSNRTALAKTVNASPRKIAERLLILLLNEFLMIEMTRRVQSWMHVDYDSITPNFLSIASFVGCGVADRVPDVLREPPTMKLEPLDPDLIPNRAAVQELASFLDGVRNEAIRQRRSFAEVCDWDAPRIRVYGIEDAFASFLGRKGAFSGVLRHAMRHAAGSLT